MAKTRLFIPTTPLEILKAHMRDSETREKYHRSTTDFINRRQLNRVFNDFPLMISDNVLSESSAKLISILFTVTEGSLNSEGSMRILNRDTQTMLSALIKKIAYIGCQSFIKDSAIHPDLVKLLGWQTYAAKLDICELLCAFTADTFLSILKESNLKSPVAVDLPAFTAVTDYINHHYHQAVLDVLRESGHSYSNDEYRYTTAAAISAAAAVTGLLFVGGIGFAMMANDNSNSNRKR